MDATRVERGKIILQRRDELALEHPDWHELALRATAIKQLKEEDLITMRIEELADQFPQMHQKDLENMAKQQLKNENQIE